MAATVFPVQFFPECKNKTVTVKFPVNIYPIIILTDQAFREIIHFSAPYRRSQFSI